MGPLTAPPGHHRPRLACALGAWLCAAFACLIGTPAAAQETATALGKAIIVVPLSLSKAADMDFGKIAVNAAGTIVMNPTATPTCTVTGGLIKYGVCQPAVFEGYGQTGRTVRIKLPPANRIDLVGPGGATMPVSNLVMNAGSDLVYRNTSNGFRRYRIDSGDGAFLFRVGGTLNVAAGQAYGLYSAIFSIDIIYE